MKKILTALLASFVFAGMAFAADAPAAHTCTTGCSKAKASCKACCEKAGDKACCKDEAKSHCDKDQAKSHCDKDEAKGACEKCAKPKAEAVAPVQK